MKKKMTYGLSAAGLALGLLVTLALRSSGGGDAAPTAKAAVPVSVARVRRGDLARTVTLSGEFHPFQQVDVHAKVAGYLRSIRVDVGDHVGQGETIATLEIPELADDLRRAKAATLAAKDDMRRAQAHHDEVHRASRRLLEVAKQRPDLVAEQDTDAARDQDEAADAALAAARHSVEEGEANESRVQTMVAYGLITAPFDGVITRRYADKGALIQAGTSSNTEAMPVVSLAEDKLLRLVFPVPESAVPFVREGTPLQIEVQAVRRTLQGTVARLAGKLDRATRTMHVEADVPNPDLTLAPGMYATVTTPLERRSNVLCVPVRALAEGRAMVVDANGVVERRQVKAGLETPDLVEVLDGLREGELVVVGASGVLREGDRAVARVEGEPQLADAKGAGR